MIQDQDKEFIPSDYGMNFDLDIVKSCIKKISVLDKTQTQRALAATARNRQMNGKPGIKNMTIGQAYFNLNKTSPRFDIGKLSSTRTELFGKKSGFGNIDPKAKTYQKFFNNN